MQAEHWVDRKPSDGDVVLDHFNVSLTPQQEEV